MNENFSEAKVFSGQAPEQPVAEALVMSGKSLVQSKAGFHTAVSVQRPRNLDAIVKAVEREAEYAGDSFYYLWKITDKDGKKHPIQGGSVGLALCLAREWSNSVVLTDLIEEDGKWVFTSTFVDLEKGFTLQRIFRKTIPTKSFGKFDKDRTEDLSFQKAQSQAIRNVVLNATPKWLQERAIEVAKKAELQSITKAGIDVARNKVVEFFKKHGIIEDQIVDYLGKKLNECVVEDIQALRSLAAQVHRGDVSVEDIFPPIITAQPKTEASVGALPKNDQPPEAKKEVPPGEPKTHQDNKAAETIGKEPLVPHGEPGPEIQEGGTTYPKNAIPEPTGAKPKEVQPPPLDEKPKTPGQLAWLELQALSQSNPPVYKQACKETGIVRAMTPEAAILLLAKAKELITTGWQPPAGRQRKLA